MKNTKGKITITLLFLELNPKITEIATQSELTRTHCFERQIYRNPGNGTPMRLLMLVTFRMTGFTCSSQYALCHI